MKCLGVLRLRGVFFLCHLMMLHCSLWKDSKMCVCVFWFCVCAQLLSRVQLLASPWSVAISQAKILEWLIISFFRGSSRPRDRTWVSCIGRSQWSHLGSLFWFYLLVFPNMFAAKLLLKNRASSQFLTHLSHTYTQIHTYTHTHTEQT